MKGLVFDVQRFSVHDGPGIRTTVFMKGCSLRCRWCHNPEGLERNPQLRFLKEKCIGCGACHRPALLSDATLCPSRALQVAGQEMSVSEVVAEGLKDCAYYGRDGGVTFSGGECLLQADFVSAASKILHENGVSVAVDTAGFVPWEEIEKTLSDCDLYLYDIKCENEALHRAFTGGGNALIWKNLEKLNQAKKEIWIRIPVIPDFNDTTEEMERIAARLSPFSQIRRVTLIPYHTLGREKYEPLGMTPLYTASRAILSEELEAFGNIFKKFHLPVEGRDLS